MEEIISKVAGRARAYAYLVLGSCLRVNTRQVMFFTFQGQYTCNPKYISEKLYAMAPEIRCVWVTWEGEETSFPDYVKTVKFGTAAYYQALYRSKVWVDNAFNFPKRPLQKKPGQYYVQTMHGSLGIKKIGTDANRDPKRNSRGIRSAKLTDYILSNSDFEDMVYRTSFWPETPILKIGHARNDILIDCKAKKGQFHKSVRKFYHLGRDAKLVLYAPTFRRNNFPDLKGIDFRRLKAALETRFGGTWYIINRLHPRDVRRDNIVRDEPFVLDGNAYTDIQELMTAVDFGITDYSSWIFDYVVTGKNGLIFAEDLKDYENSTGFYYPITSAPFPVAVDNAQMEKAIAEFSETEYENRVSAFLKEKGCVDDGHASERAAEAILCLLEDKRPAGLI